MERLARGSYPSFERPKAEDRARVQDNRRPGSKLSLRRSQAAGKAVDRSCSNQCGPKSELVGVESFENLMEVSDPVAR